MKYLFFILLICFFHSGYGSLPKKDDGIWVYITAKDFYNCEYTDANDCALARALKRKLPNHHVIVGPFDVQIDYLDYGTNSNLYFIIQII